MVKLYLSGLVLGVRIDLGVGRRMTPARLLGPSKPLYNRGILSEVGAFVQGIAGWRAESQALGAGRGRQWFLPEELIR
jgi:hypothetical protein